jgi:hypothetical protein
MKMVQMQLPELAAFLLLTFFPQVFTVLYLGFLQEIILPADVTLGTIMLTFVIVEIVLVWRYMRCIITRQTALFYRDVRGSNVNGNVTMGEQQ